MQGRKSAAEPRTNFRKCQSVPLTWPGRDAEAFAWLEYSLVVSVTAEIFPWRLSLLPLRVASCSSVRRTSCASVVFLSPPFFGTADSTSGTDNTKTTHTPQSSPSSSSSSSSSSSFFYLFLSRIIKGTRPVKDREGEQLGQAATAENRNEKKKEL